MAKGITDARECFDQNSTFLPLIIWSIIIVTIIITSTLTIIVIITTTTTIFTILISYFHFSILYLFCFLLYSHYIKILVSLAHSLPRIIYIIVCLLYFVLLFFIDKDWLKSSRANVVPFPFTELY